MGMRQLSRCWRHRADSLKVQLIKHHSDAEMINWHCLNPSVRGGSARILAREKTGYTERKYEALPTRLLLGARHAFCAFPVLRFVLNSL